MEPLDLEVLKPLARKYVWWKTPDEAVAMPERVVAQVMNIGDYDDVQALVDRVGEFHLRDVLRQATTGPADAGAAPRMTRSFTPLLHPILLTTHA